MIIVFKQPVKNKLQNILNIHENLSYKFYITQMLSTNKRHLRNLTRRN